MSGLVLNFTKDKLRYAIISVSFIFESKKEKKNAEIAKMVVFRKFSSHHGIFIEVNFCQEMLGNS